MKRYNFFIDDGQLASLEQMAKDKGVSVSHEIREAIQNRIDRHGPVRLVAVEPPPANTTVVEPESCVFPPSESTVNS